MPHLCKANAGAGEGVLESAEPTQRNSDGDSDQEVDLPAGARAIGEELLCLWEVDLGETGMAVVFRAGNLK